MLKEVSVCRGTEYGQKFRLREAVLLDIPRSKGPNVELSRLRDRATMAWAKDYIIFDARFAMCDWVRAITDAVDVLAANRDKDDDFLGRDSESYKNYKDRTTRIKCLNKRVVRSCQDFWAALNGEEWYELIPEEMKVEIFECLVRIQYWALQEAVIQKHLCYAVSLVPEKRPANCRFYGTWRNCPTDDDFWILDDFTLVSKNAEEIMPRLDEYFKKRMDAITCDPETFGTFRR